MLNRNAKFSIGEVVKHRIHPFRGVIFDVDPTFDNTEEWWNSIPENHRPKKDQPFYHLWLKTIQVIILPTCRNKTYSMMTVENQLGTLR